MSDAEDDWQKLSRGPRSRVTKPEQQNDMRKKRPVTSDPAADGAEETPMMVTLDTIAAVVGIVCLVVTLLAVTTNAFEVVEEEESIEAIHRRQSLTENSTTSLERRLHALLEGRVGHKSLVAVLAARAQHRRPDPLGQKRLSPPSSGESSNENAGANVDYVEDTLPDVRTLQLNGDAERSVFDDDASFYVSIAQFKDILCPMTIQEIYMKARNPRRVFAGIVDQREVNPNVTENGIGYPNYKVPPIVFHTHCDGTCFPWYMMKSCGTSDFCPTDNIRVRHSWPKDGKGPTWGRYYAMLMYQGESYFMMIDSHSRFSPHWDMHCVLNLQLVPKTSKKAVLSHYPGGYRELSSLLSQRREPAHMTMCSAHYTREGIIRMNSKGTRINGFPIMQPFSAGGFVVGDAKFVHEVPFDPYLFYVFDGEEILYSVRLWTHGFDMFTPRSNILFHNYGRHKAPRFWSIGAPSYVAQQFLGQSRVRYLMRTLKNQTTERMVSDEWAEEKKINREEEVYGLGTERSLEAYHKYAGIDPVNWTITSDRNCQDDMMLDGKYHKYEDQQKI